MKIELKPYDDRQEYEKRAGWVVDIIMCSAPYFEYHTRLKPTVFMSHDLFYLVARGARSEIVVHDRGRKHTICGYAVEFVFGENKLYFGYELANNLERG